MKKKLAAILLGAFLITGLTGCGSDIPEGTAAVVNDVAISQEELDVNYEQFLQMYESYGVDTSDEMLRLNLRNSILESLVIQELLVQEAANRGITVSDEEVSQQVQAIKDAYYAGDDAAYEAALAESGYTAASYAEAVKEQLLMEQLQDALVNQPEVVDVAKASHILVATEEEALAVIAKLENGEDFAALAQEVSTDMGSAVDGGSLGYFALNGDTTSKMVEEFSAAVREQEIGTFSASPVQSQFGYHIILVEDRASDVDLLADPEKYGAILQGIYSSGLDNLAMALMETAEIEVLIDTTKMESAE